MGHRMFDPENPKRNKGDRMKLRNKNNSKNINSVQSGKTGTCETVLHTDLAQPAEHLCP